MHTTRPRLFWSLFTFVVSAGLVVAGTALAFGHVSLAPALVLAAFVVVTEAAPVDVRQGIKTSLSVVALFVAIAYGGLPLAVVVALVSGTVSGFTAHGSRTIKGMFNTGIDLVQAAVAAMVFAAVASTSMFSPAPGAALASSYRLTVALLLAGLVYSAANAVFMGSAMHAVRGVPFRHTVADVAKGIALLQFVYVGLAAIAYVLLVEVGVAGVVLLVAPLAVARNTLRSVQDQQGAYDRMVRAFVKAIELKDGYTRGHAERVSDLSVLVAERMGLSYEDRQLIRYGAILHDVGKIGVSLGILCKAGPLEDDERAEMQQHPDIGAEMLADIDFLQPALAIVRHHHERMDGYGYPTGLTGDAIPLLTRVVTAVDAFDAMTSTRSYRRALSVQAALQELVEHAGTQFDEEVVGHLIAVIAEHGWSVTDEPVTMIQARDASHGVAVQP